MVLPAGGWGTLAGSDPLQAVNAERGWLNAGLTYKVHEKATYQVTAGAAGTDTFTPKIAGTAIVSGAVAWTSSHNATATAIATAINANRATNFTNGFYVLATVSTDTVTIHYLQWKDVSADVGSFTMTVANNADGTLVDFTGYSATPVEIQPGITSVPTGNLLTLNWDSAYCYLETDAVNALITTLYPGAAQAFEYFRGTVPVPTTPQAAPVGSTYATTELKGIPWVGAQGSLIIYPASAGVWDYLLGAA